MASVRQPVVRRLYHARDRKFFKGRHPYVAHNNFPSPTPRLPLRTNQGLGFVAFDQYKSLLADENGKLSGPRTVIAGLGAGVTESLLAVTPFESIKTTLFVPPCVLNVLTWPFASRSDRRANTASC